MKRIIAAELVYWLVILVVWVLVNKDNPRFRMSVCYYTFRSCQNVARVIGRAGIAAEVRYHQERSVLHG